MHRHHRALAEADERKVAIVQAQPAEFGVEIGVDQAGGAFVALLEGCGPLVHEAVPLPPHGILVASVGRVGTGEAGMGQGAL